MAIKSKKRLTSVLGLALNGSQLQCALLRRTNGSFTVQKFLDANLALSPLHGDPELVGREIRNHLDRAGIRERRCVVALPMSWISTQDAVVPELSPEDEASFLQLEAERGFLYGPEVIAVAHSRYRIAEGDSRALMVAVPRNHLNQVERALRAAQLKALSFTLGLPAMQRGEDRESEGVLALFVGEHGADLQVTCGGGVVALRALDATLDTEGSIKRLPADPIAREVRITLGQLPAEFRDRVREVRILGGSDTAQRLHQEICQRVEAMGLACRRLAVGSTVPSIKLVPAETPVSSAVMIAARHLAGTAPCFEFLPPRVSALQRFAARFSSKKLFWSGAAAGVAAALALAMFLWQQWRLSGLEGRWKAMEEHVTAVDAIQGQIRTVRPWYDESFTSLRIMRAVTESFPEDGSVTAKRLEIRNLTTVTCTGTATDKESLLGMLDKLKVARDVQIRGESPVQYSFQFQWQEGAARDN